MSSKKDMAWLLDEISADWSEEEWGQYRQLKAIYRAEADRLRLARLLKERLAEKGITQRELAQNLGLQASEVSRILSGKANITTETQIRITNELGLRIEYVPIEASA